MRTSVRLLAVAGTLGVSALAASAAEGGQEPSYRYAYVRGTDTINTETITVGATAMRGVMTQPGQGRVEWEQQHRDRTPTTLIIRVYPLNAAPGAPPNVQVTMTPRGDSMHLEQRAGTGAPQSRSIAVPPGTVPFIGNSVLHASIVAQHARAFNRSSLNVVAANGARLLQAQVAVSGDTTALIVGGVTVRTVWAGQTPAEITVPAQGIVVKRVRDR